MRLVSVASRLGLCFIPQSNQKEEQAHPQQADAAGGPRAFDQEQEESDEEESGILVAVVGVGHGVALSLLQAVQRGQERVEIHEAAVGPDVGSIARLGHGHEHALVEGGDHRLAVRVLLVSLGPAVPVVFRDGAAGLGRHADGVDGNALLGGFGRAGEGVVLVVLAIRQQQDHPSRLALRVKGVCGQGQGGTDRRALQGDRFGANGIEEQLDGSQVLRQRSLHIGFARKDDEADAVPIELLDHAFDAPLGQVQPGHADVLREHGAADVEGDHDVHAFGFHFLHARAPFGVQHADGEQREGGAPHEEFPDGTPGAGIRPQRAAEFGICRFRHALLLPPVMRSEEHETDGGHHQRGPSPGIMQVELRRHLPQQHAQGEHAGPEGDLEQDEPGHVGKHLVCARCFTHGRLRMKTWRRIASEARQNRAIHPSRGNSSVRLL